jgi:hypothetical protein
MQRILVFSVSVAAMTAWAASAVADSPKLKGDYGFTGSSTCVTTLDGFTPNPPQTPDEIFPPTSLFSDAVQGIRTFNGDGNGTDTGSSMGVDYLANTIKANAGASTFSFSFTYTLNGDGTFTTTASSPPTGMVTAGPRAGQSFSIFNFPILTGQISQNAMTLMLASLTRRWKPLFIRAAPPRPPLLSSITRSHQPEVMP